MDGILSALDTRVSKLIVNRVLNGLLKTRIVFVSVYDIEHVREFDEVIVMEKGKIVDHKPVSEFFEVY